MLRKQQGHPENFISARMVQKFLSLSHFNAELSVSQSYPNWSTLHYAATSIKISFFVLKKHSSKAKTELEKRRDVCNDGKESGPIKQCSKQRKSSDINCTI